MHLQEHSGKVSKHIYFMQPLAAEGDNICPSSVITVKQVFPLPLNYRNSPNLQALQNFTPELKIKERDRIGCSFLKDNQDQRMITLPPMGYIITFNLTLKYIQYCLLLKLV